MWGKKKRESQERAEFAEFAEGMLRQVIREVATDGIQPENILATDAMLQTYWGSGINWRALWDFVHLGYQQEQINAEQVAQILSLPVDDVGPPPYGAAPYWASDPHEPGGWRPLSILAFLPTRFRGPLGGNPKTHSEVLKLLAYDPYGRCANAARQQLIDRYSN